MSRTVLLLVLALTGVGAFDAAAVAQPATTSQATNPGKPPHKAHRRADSTSMATSGSASGVAPTGPDTTTASAGATSDLSGSTGATVDAPAPIAPPSPAPPGGAASGGSDANQDTAPH